MKTVCCATPTPTGGIFEMQRSLLCLCLTEGSIEANRQCLRQYRSLVDLVELRADFLQADQLSKVPEFPSMIDLPAILTIRRKQDGGMFEGTSGERNRLLKDGLSGRFALVDLEDDCRGGDLERSAKDRGTTIIRSYHDFSQVPPDLDSIVERLSRNPNEIPKIAVTKTCRGS